MLSAIVLAAGKGSRMKSACSKPLVKIDGKPALAYSLEVFDRHAAIDEIIVVSNRANRGQVFSLLRQRAYKKVKAIVLGGRRRQDSVYNGLDAVDPASKWVLIHDSARPFIGSGFVTRVIRAGKKYGAALLAVRPKATIKVCRGGFVRQTLERGSLCEVQTPQVFRKDILVEAYRKYRRQDVTDDASLLERSGARVKIVEGNYENIKITTLDDLLLAGLIVKGKNV